MLSDAESDVFLPEAGFSASPLSGYTPLSVQFSDLSTNNLTEWDWDFGDGTAVSYQQNQLLHIYTKPGIFTVKLTVRNGYGPDEEIKTAYIAVSGRIYLPLTRQNTP